VGFGEWRENRPLFGAATFAPAQGLALVKIAGTSRVVALCDWTLALQEDCVDFFPNDSIVFIVD
jgi:hypothetical protein